MAFHRYVTISGTRFDITGQEITGETSCDRCGRYTESKTTVEVNAKLLGDMPHNVPVELCQTCVTTFFPGLVDVANKVMSRA